jgi:DNA-binding transcriptional MerR regulator
MDNTPEEFRAAELLERTGIPRTTLHYYLREGLLPPPRKTSPNSALYSQRHVDRIVLILRLRSPELGSLPFSRIHRVLDRVEKGVSAEVAVHMERSMGLPVDDDDHWTLAALAERFGVPEGAIDTMVRVGLLVPDPFGRVRGFTSLEGRLARSLHQVVEETPLTFEDLEPIARVIGELSRYEMGLRDRVVEGRARGEDNALATLALQRAADLLHPYLLSRSTERQIAARRRRAALEKTS